MSYIMNLFHPVCKVYILCIIRYMKLGTTLEISKLRILLPCFEGKNFGAVHEQFNTYNIVLYLS